MAGLFPTGTFRSLANYNYRLWAGGAIVSNVGTWMQRVAQDWLVLTQLTHNNASAVGLVMALQFGPQMLMLPVSGFAADFFDRRKLLMATQAAMGLCALGLGLGIYPDKDPAAAAGGATHAAVHHEHQAAHHLAFDDVMPSAQKDANAVSGLGVVGHGPAISR